MMVYPYGDATGACVAALNKRKRPLLCLSRSLTIPGATPHSLPKGNPCTEQHFTPLVLVAHGVKRGSAYSGSTAT